MFTVIISALLASDALAQTTNWKQWLDVTTEATEAAYTEWNDNMKGDIRRIPNDFENSDAGKEIELGY